MTGGVIHAPLLEGVRLAQLPSLSLYVHIPWCIRKCPYCDFNSHELKSDLSEDRYVDALIADLEASLPNVWGRRVHTVFFGGGTPSLFSPEALDRFLSAARAVLPIEADAEITLEANPGTFETAKFAAFRALGINRLSVGIQSFDPQRLQAIGRVHDDREAHRAVEIAHAHFENFNLDLMYALPGQDIDGALADVGTAIATGAPHVSAYHLTIEPNTYFHRHTPVVPDDDVAAAMQSGIETRLADAGYTNYETSAFARPSRQARHNLGKLSLRDRIFRQMRHKHPREYMERALAGNAIQTEADVTPAELPFEFMMNALRLREGFELTTFTERTGLPLNALTRELEEAERRGLLERDHLRARPTDHGRRFLNDLLQIFLA
jgi:putative oxygen-independent coproporphyrinogen III oxidase